MIFQIRSKATQVLSDTDVYLDRNEHNNKETNDKEWYVDIKSCIILDNYSNFLLENINKKEDIIKDFSNIANLREWLWEKSKINSENNTKDSSKKYYDAYCYIKNMLKEICKKYDGLYLNED